MEFKRIASFATIFVLILTVLALTGCTSYQFDGVKYADAESMQKAINDQKAQAVSEAKASVDITADNAAVKAAVEADVAAVKQAEIDALKDTTVAKDATIAELEKKLEVQVAVATGEGIVFKNIEANIGENFSTVLDNEDVSRLIDGTINFNDANVDVREEIVIAGDVMPKTSLYDEEFCDTVYMIFADENSVEYNYIFDDGIDVADISEDEPLVISFLGKNIEIVGYSAGELEIKEGTSFWVAQDATVSGVTLIDVSADGDSAGIQVGDRVEWIDVGDSEVVNGVEVRVDDAIAVHELSQNKDMAKITIGEDIAIFVADEDEFVENDENWVWNIDVTAGVLNSIGVVYMVQSNDLDDDVAPLKPGEKITLPNDYVSFTYDIRNVATEYFDFEFDEYGVDDLPTYKIKASKDDSIVMGIVEVEQINWNGTHAFFVDSNGDKVNSTTAPVLTIGDTELTLALVDIGGGLFRMDVGTELDVTSTGLAYLGSTEETDEATEIVLNTVNVGSNECKAVSNYGLIVDKNEDNDNFRVYVPKEQVELVLTVG